MKKIIITLAATIALFSCTKQTSLYQTPKPTYFDSIAYNDALYYKSLLTVRIYPGNSQIESHTYVNGICADLDSNANVILHLKEGDSVSVVANIGDLPTSNYTKIKLTRGNRGNEWLGTDSSLGKVQMIYIQPKIDSSSFWRYN